MITQLRDVSATRQSAEMAVENQQEPASGEVHKMVAAAPAVLKVKRERRFACQIFHPNPLSCNLPTNTAQNKTIPSPSGRHAGTILRHDPMLWLWTAGGIEV
jgi:hypothetical protein